MAGIERAHEEIRRIVDLQLELQRQAGKEKWPFEPPATNEAVESRVRDFLGDRLRATINNPDKVLRLEGTSNLREELLAHLAAPGDEDGVPLVSKEIMDAFEAILKEEVRSSILRRWHAPRRPADRRDPTNLDRDWLPSPHPWLGDLHSWPNPGHHHRDSRLDRRGAAARFDRPGRA